MHFLSHQHGVSELFSIWSPIDLVLLNSSCTRSGRKCLMAHQEIFAHSCHNPSRPRSQIDPLLSASAPPRHCKHGQELHFASLPLHANFSQSGTQTVAMPARSNVVLQCWLGYFCVFWVGAGGLAVGTNGCLLQMRLGFVLILVRAVGRFVGCWKIRWLFGWGCTGVNVNVAPCVKLAQRPTVRAQFWSKIGSSRQKLHDKWGQ